MIRKMQGKSFVRLFIFIRYILLLLLLLHVYLYSIYIINDLRRIEACRHAIHASNIACSLLPIVILLFSLRKEIAYSNPC